MQQRPPTPAEIQAAAKESLTAAAEQASFYFDELKSEGFDDEQAFELLKLWHEKCIISPMIPSAIQSIAFAIAELAGKDSSGLRVVE